MTEFGTPQHFLEIEKLCQDKDAEIDRLRSERDALLAEKNHLKDCRIRALNAEDELDRLRAENEQMRGLLKIAAKGGWLDLEEVEALLAKTAKEGD